MMRQNQEWTQWGSYIVWAYLEVLLALLVYDIEFLFLCDNGPYHQHVRVESVQRNS